MTNPLIVKHRNIVLTPLSKKSHSIPPFGSGRSDHKCTNFCNLVASWPFANPNKREDMCRHCSPSLLIQALHFFTSPHSPQLSSSDSPLCHCLDLTVSVYFYANPSIHASLLIPNCHSIAPSEVASLTINTYMDGRWPWLVWTKGKELYEQACTCRPMNNLPARPWWIYSYEG